MGRSINRLSAINQSLQIAIRIRFDLIRTISNLKAIIIALNKCSFSLSTIWLNKNCQVFNNFLLYFQANVLEKCLNKSFFIYNPWLLTNKVNLKNFEEGVYGFLSSKNTVRNQIDQNFKHHWKIITNCNYFRLKKQAVIYYYYCCQLQSFIFIQL